VGLSIDSRSMRVETLMPGCSAEKSGNIQVPLGVQGLELGTGGNTLWRRVLGEAVIRLG